MIHQGTSASGHFTAMPTRSLHARGPGARGDNFRVPDHSGVEGNAGQSDSRNPALSRRQFDGSVE